MTIFELVKITLDELYKDGLVEHQDKLDDQIRSRMKYLTESYKELSQPVRTPINYNDTATRFAYVFKYVAAHGAYLVQALEAVRLALNGNIFKGDTLRLSCVGGGPGSDIVGVLKYLDEYSSEPVSKIICYLLDGEQAWADTWTEVGQSIGVDKSVNVNFQKLDVTAPNSWSAQKKFLGADLFTLSYFVSEVKSFDNGVVKEFWKKLFDEAKQGALFAYIDNGHDSFNEYFDSCWTGRSDIECLLNEENSWKTPHYKEQASDLGVFRNKFGQSPKIKSLLSF